MDVKVITWNHLNNVKRKKTMVETKENNRYTYKHFQTDTLDGNFLKYTIDINNKFHFIVSC